MISDWGLRKIGTMVLISEQTKLFSKSMLLVPHFLYLKNRGSNLENAELTKKVYHSSFVSATSSLVPHLSFYTNPCFYLENAEPASRVNLLKSPSFALSVDRVSDCVFNPVTLTIELFPHLSCIRRHEGIWQKFWAHAAQPTGLKNNFRCWSAHGDCARKDPS